MAHVKKHDKYKRSLRWFGAKFIKWFHSNTGKTRCWTMARTAPLLHLHQDFRRSVFDEHSDSENIKVSIKTER